MERFLRFVGRLFSQNNWAITIVAFLVVSAFELYKLPQSFPLLAEAIGALIIAIIAGHIADVIDR